MEIYHMSKNTWGGNREGAGAPITVGKENRRKQRVISLNDSEFTKLKEIAQSKDMSVSELVRSTFEL